VAIGFVPGNALLPFQETATMGKLAKTGGSAKIVIAGGFGEGSLPLALSRARRLAEALTADGVPPGIVHVTASAEGSGGFVQLVY
jgi:hypothetical protein